MKDPSANELCEPSLSGDGDARGPTARVVHGLPTLPALLGLRALAATSVILFHLHHLLSLPLPPGCRIVGSHFGLGVQMFFVLSAFSLCYSTSGSTSRQGWIREYTIKRVFRIAPLFYAALVMWVLIYWSRGVSPNPYTLVLNLTFTFGMVPGRHESLVAAGWTVGVEMLFYCVLPVALVTVRNMRGALLLLACAAAVSAAGRTALSNQGGVLAQYAGMSLVTSLPLFVMGLVGYMVWRSSSRTPLVLIGVFLTSTALPALLLTTVGGRLIGSARLDVMLWGACFAGITVWQAWRPSRFLACSLLRFMGNRSYSLYLTHPIVIYCARERLLELNSWASASIGAWAFWVTGLALMIVVTAVSTATHYIIEAPGIRLGQRLVRKGHAPMSPPAS